MVSTRIEVEDYVNYLDTTSGNIGGVYRSDDVDIQPTTDFGGGFNVGWIRDGEWLTYTTNLTSGNYDIKVRVASADPNPGDLRVKLGNQELGIFDVKSTGDWQNWQTLTLNNVAIPGGSNQLLRLDMIGGSFNLNWIEFDQVPSGGVQSPFGGTPRAIKDGARIEAEDFDNGGQGVAYNDTDSSNLGGQYRPDQGVDIENTTDVGGGHNVGWIRDGESLEYTTNVTGGTYNIKVRVASANPNPGDLRVKLGNQELGIFDVKSTGGWQNWQTLTLGDVAIAGGSNQRLRFEVIGGSFNLNWIEFDQVPSGGVQSPFGGTPRAIKDGARIEAEDFDNGGQGVAYNDTDSSNLGGQYRPDQGVDIENTTDVGGGHNVGWIRDGESLEYTTNVIGGNYDIKVRVASANPNPGDLRVKLGNQELGIFDVKSTGGWQNWQTLTLGNLAIAGGSNQRLRFEVIDGSFNLNWIEFEEAKLKIMPLGDSITQGVDGVTSGSEQGGYRTDLWNQLQVNGLDNVDFVGSRSTGPDILMDKDHEGHPGWTIDQILNGRASDPDAGSINDWLNASRPDMVLLKAGTNDMGFSKDSPAKAADQLSDLLDKITDLLPNAEVLVASIAPVDPSRNSSIRQDFDDRVIAFNELIPGIVEDKVGAGKNVTFVDVFGALTLDDLAPDGFHPNAQGYSKMADVWFNAIV